MDVYYPIYLCDMHECEAAIEMQGATFFQVAIGDEDSAGLAVQAAGDFPYGYDYTCEWDATLIYLAVRPKLTGEQMETADSLFGPLFMYKHLSNSDNYRFFANPPIPKRQMRADKSAFPKA